MSVSVKNNITPTHKHIPSFKNLMDIQTLSIYTKQNGKSLYLKFPI